MQSESPLSWQLWHKMLSFTSLFFKRETAIVLYVFDDSRILNHLIVEHLIVFFTLFLFVLYFMFLPESFYNT
uniref:Uncharacterized protein n=1 Tax=Papilio xuthus TaxID=66420 RepID=I4DJZ1_PAPXU|nr:unknown unsecreted protein [Papilio xuthus]